MTDILLDASALLALLHEEAGMEVVADALAASSMSAVNATEVMAVLARRLGPEVAVARFQAFRLPILPFTADQADEAQRLLARHRGTISLADAACLATAMVLRMTILTGDRVWAGLSLPLEVRLIRP